MKLNLWNQQWNICNVLIHKCYLQPSQYTDTKKDSWGIKKIQIVVKWCRMAILGSKEMVAMEHINNWSKIWIYTNRKSKETSDL